jgi:glutamine amidotransferase
MSRWLAYSGSPVRLEELRVERDRSLIDQSLHSRQGATPADELRASQPRVHQ